MEYKIKVTQEDKDNDARRLANELNKAKASGASQKEIKRLEKELEMARYVGD